jgi:hypothetical protein
MTRLSDRTTRLRFITDAEVRYRGRMRALVIEADNNGYTASIRLAGSRLRYEFSWAGLHDWAAELYVRRQRDERKKEREQRRKEKTHGSRS